MRFLLLLSLLFCGLALQAEPAVKTYHFHYDVVFTRPSAGFKTWEAWIPMPVSGPYQKVLNYRIQTAAPYEIKTEPRFGNRMIHVQGPADMKFPVALKATYTIERRLAKVTPSSALEKWRGWNPKDFKAADKMIPLGGRIAELGREESRGTKTDTGKIKNMFDYVVRTMTYSKKGTGWGHGDALWACDSKRGNCTDFHSLFIGMARSQKIPARFEIGFPMPAKGKGEVGGYHCWAWAFEREHGWFPIDASEAKLSGKSAEYFGRLPNDRIRFTIGRDLTLAPTQKAGPVNFFIYPYVEVDGKSTVDYQKSFRVE